MFLSHIGLTALLSLLSFEVVLGFALLPYSQQREQGSRGQLKNLGLTARNKNDEELINNSISSSRRNFGEQLLRGSFAATILGVTGQPIAAAAAKDTTGEDKDKILRGYKRLNYLLDNWEKETTFCGTDIDPFTGKKKCERTPLKVMDYMGYRSTNDPLFKADKTLKRLDSLAPSSKETEYFDAVENWQQTADEASGMAYTSSWAGPQNPNGGDESIEYFLDRAKEQVVKARNILKDVIDILGLAAV